MESQVEGGVVALQPPRPPHSAPLITPSPNDQHPHIGLYP